MTTDAASGTREAPEHPDARRDLVTMDWGFDLDDLCDIVGHQRERRFVRLGSPYGREGSIDIDRGTRFLARPIDDDRGDDISVTDRLRCEGDGDGRQIGRRRWRERVGNEV